MSPMGLEVREEQTGSLRQRLEFPVIVIEAGGFVVRNRIARLYKICQCAFKTRLDCRPVVAGPIFPPIHRFKKFQTQRDQMMQFTVDRIVQIELRQFHFNFGTQPGVAMGRMHEIDRLHIDPARFEVGQQQIAPGSFHTSLRMFDGAFHLGQEIYLMTDSLDTNGLRVSIAHRTELANQRISFVLRQR